MIDMNEIMMDFKQKYPSAKMDDGTLHLYKDNVYMYSCRLMPGEPPSIRGRHQIRWELLCPLNDPEVKEDDAIVVTLSELITISTSPAKALVYLIQIKHPGSDTEGNKQLAATILELFRLVNPDRPMSALSKDAIPGGLEVIFTRDNKISKYEVADMREVASQLYQGMQYLTFVGDDGEIASINRNDTSVIWLYKENPDGSTDSKN